MLSVDKCCGSSCVAQSIVFSLIRTSQVFLSSSQLAKRHTHQPKHSHGKRIMATTEEQNVNRAQRMNWMHTDVAELQNGLEGSATLYEELMVQFVTSAPRVKSVVEAGASSQVGGRAPPRGSGARKRETISHTCGAARRIASPSQHSRSNCRNGSDHSMII